MLCVSKCSTSLNDISGDQLIIFKKKKHSYKVRTYISRILIFLIRSIFDKYVCTLYTLRMTRDL